MSPAAQNTSSPAAPAIRSFLGDERSAVRYAAAGALLSALGEKDDVGLKLLVAALEDDGEVNRQSAIRQLGNVGSPAARAVPALKKQLAIDAERTRAAVALFRIRGRSEPEAYKVMLNALRNGTQQERLLVSFAIRDRPEADQTAIPALVASLDAGGDRSERIHAAEALGKLGALARPALPALRKHLATDPNVPTRSTIREAIHRIESSS